MATQSLNKRNIESQKNTEKRRLEESERGVKNWRLWGPYLTERQWGTVREDYSPDGAAWEHISHDDARSRAYRWGEEGIAGISDEKQNLCFAVSFWNGQDPILKERLFGLTGNEGNHGEDVKEYYYYLDSTPTHSYMKMLYKYPQGAFPYCQLVEENKQRGKDLPEFELIDTGIFDEDRYFDIFVEYAKVDTDDLLVKITAKNHGPDEAELHIVPQLWFRNTWSWNSARKKPAIYCDAGSIRAEHADIGTYHLYTENSHEAVFTENETNVARLYGQEASGFFKDGINDYIVNEQKTAVNPEQFGTKAAVICRTAIPAGASHTIRLRLSSTPIDTPFKGFETTIKNCIETADDFFGHIQEQIKSEDARHVQRQAFAGMMWTKQFYYYNIAQWLRGDPNQFPPPDERLQGRNSEWEHLNNADIISMPDTWEYPWYAAWDLAFHCLPIAMIDPYFAKKQLMLLTSEWYLHPNGQLPAYEWAFGDVNPPVHAWATWRVYKMDQKQKGGEGDLDFLERVYQKLLLNFTWWVNRKDQDGNNLFQGGFLGLDNIGVFDRSAPLPTGGHIEQADGTSWMAMYCLNMLKISLELAERNHTYEDMATKFFEHFLYIASAMTNVAGKGIGLWDEQDEFYYDVLHTGEHEHCSLKIRSMVGLIPLFAVETLEPEQLEKVPEFRRRLNWFLDNRPDLARLVSRWQKPGMGDRRLLSLLRGHRMKMLLKRMLDSNEFFSDYGIRALSKVHEKNPYKFQVNSSTFTVHYRPAESDSGLFGGNSNWRGPIWFPVNYLLIESLQKFHHYYGDDFKIECPTGSGNYVTIDEVAQEITRRLTTIFLSDENGRRPVFGTHEKIATDPNFKDYVLFHEYFHGDNGSGVGASHQTGWTGLIAKLLQPRPS
ncbi:MAG: glucosidase [Planctomycetes bacterium]|nr:glucosidase [Planctomycetota bacterium]